MDIKTGEREGIPVLAAADGYISRIRVSPTGFGKAIYLRHANGFTTVYAHLLDFYGPVADYVKNAQYRDESFEVQLYPGESHFHIRQGDTIALSGNTGGSTGPHLHFEVRSTLSERPLNPLLFEYLFKSVQTFGPSDSGFVAGQDTSVRLLETAMALVEDTVPPEITSVMLYALDDESFIEQYGKSPAGKLQVALRMAGGMFVPDSILLIHARGRIGFALATFDRLVPGGNSTNVYSLEMEVDGRNRYSFSLDEFSFSESRYVNAHMDYEEQYKNKTTLQRCFLLPGNRFSGYRKITGRGVFIPVTGKEHHIFFIARDACGNEARARVLVIGAPEPEAGNARKDSCVSKYPWNEPSDFRTGDLLVRFPERCFYEDICFHYFKDDLRLRQAASTVYYLHFPEVPVHRSFSVGIHVPLLKDEHIPKAYLGRLEKDASIVPEGGKYEKGYITADVSAFGAYVVAVDTVPPVIVPLNLTEGKDMQPETRLEIRISDSQSGIGKYRAEVDGKWILMEYDPKTSRLFHLFDGRVGPGQHVLRLQVWDDRKNPAEAQWGFSR